MQPNNYTTPGLSKLNKEVLKHGGQIDWLNSNVTRSDKLIFIDAPDGMNWNASDCGIICLSWLSGSTAEFYNEAFELVSEGVQ